MTASEPSQPRPPQGGQDQQPLQDAHQAGPPRASGDAEVGAAEGGSSRSEVGRAGRSRRGGRVGHGGSSPATTSSARARTSASTRARWTWVGWGTEVRGRLGELPARRAEVEVEPLEGVGPQPGEPGGHRPAGRAAGAEPGGLLDGGDDGRHAGGVGERFLQRGDAVLGRAVATACRRRTPRRAARPRPRRSASSRVRVDFLAETRLAISALSCVDAEAVAGADGDHRDPCQAVLVEQAAYVGDHRVAPVLGHGVDVVEHDQHHVLVAGQRREVAVVDRRVGVLLRVQHPDQQVGELRPAGPPRGGGRPRWSRGRAGRAGRRRRGDWSSRRVSSIESRVTWCRGGMPSHSSSSVAPSVPQTQAVAHDVVGRRTPTAASSRPVSALNVEDLPEPVAPAIATTVWSAASRSRPDARSTTSCAASTRASSSRPRAGRDRGLEAVDRVRPRQCTWTPGSWPRPARTSSSPSELRGGWDSQLYSAWSPCLTRLWLANRRSSTRRAASRSRSGPAASIPSPSRSPR